MKPKPTTSEEWEEYADKLKNILSKERTARKESERKFKDLWPRYQAMRDSSELWQHRAKKNLERMNALTIKNSTNQTAKD